jgi:hypothetical protein
MQPHPAKQNGNKLYEKLAESPNPDEQSEDILLEQIKDLQLQNMELIGKMLGPEYAGKGQAVYFIKDIEALHNAAINHAKQSEGELLQCAHCKSRDVSRDMPISFTIPQEMKIVRCLQCGVMVVTAMGQLVADERWNTRANK